MFAEEAHHLRQHLRRGLVAGDEQLLDDAQHLGHVERARVGDLRVVVIDPGVEQVREQVVSWLGATQFELLGEIALELVDPAFGVKALLDRDVGADAGDRIVGPLLEVGHALVGHIERVGDHLDRQWHTEVLDELDRPSVDRRFDQADRDPTDHGFERGDRLRVERLGDELAVSSVIGLVGGQHRRHAGVSLGDHLEHPLLGVVGQWLDVLPNSDE